jgi:hypothetical protein
MNIETQSAEPRRRISFDAELDRLVARELEAVVMKRRPATPEDAKVPPNVESEADEAPRQADAKEPPSEPGKVIGLARASAKNGAPVLPFSPQEEAFIENAVAFLRPLPNRDLIVEEIWLLTASREEEFPVQAIADAADETDEPDPEPEDMS